ncbi:MAG: flavin reductase family protein [Gordonia sp. (in: high G+C Gram-positive bacteria)]|uniref:flavin reductase family protein n=1 Tax=Gordonia sp. (in: high G+C Gram-positive bacteria) TaxID=84139 RepID=UPI0039E4DB4F
MSGRRVLRPGDDDVNSYALLTALVVPRPIAWVATVDADGVGNLAPHSFFTVASVRPPVLAFTSIGVKDTLRNIRATGEFTVSLVDEESVDAANATSATFGPEVDEAERAGVVMAPGVVVNPGYVAEAPAALECRLHDTVEFAGSTVVFGEVVAFSIDEDVLDGGHPVFERLRPVARLGRDEWALPPEVIRRARPD